MRSRRAGQATPGTGGCYGPRVQAWLAEIDFVKPEPVHEGHIMPQHGLLSPWAVVREKDLGAWVGGVNIAKGAVILGLLRPRQRTRRAVIFAGRDIVEFCRRLLQGEHDLQEILEAARHGRKPRSPTVASARRAPGE